jgi:hypothetical protein
MKICLKMVVGRTPVCSRGFAVSLWHLSIMKSPSVPLPNDTLSFVDSQGSDPLTVLKLISAIHLHRHHRAGTFVGTHGHGYRLWGRCSRGYRAKCQQDGYVNKSADQALIFQVRRLRFSRCLAAAAFTR